MTAQTFDRDTFECLQSIGFLSNDGTPLLMPNGEAISHPNFVRLETIAGRASNLRYMRQAMDRYEGVDQPASGTPKGEERKSVRWGKSVSGSVDIGGRRRNKTKK